jgi:hypothetical protein
MLRGRVGEIWTRSLRGELTRRLEGLRARFARNSSGPVHTTEME